MISIEIVPKDSEEVAKVVIIDSKNRVLFLKKRNKKSNSFKWDLPGGHIRVNENILKGLKREVLEETNLELSEYTFFKKYKNINFFWSSYNSLPISLSSEHIDYSFVSKNDLNKRDKFQNTAIDILNFLEAREKSGYDKN